MVQKGDKVITILLAIILIVLLVLAYKIFFLTGSAISSSGTKLSVSSVTFDADINLARGCATNVKGFVSNTGDASVDGVVVSCRLKNSGSSNTGSTDIGSIAVGGGTAFKIFIDNDCPEPQGVECTATCVNCT